MHWKAAPLADWIGKGKGASQPAWGSSENALDRALKFTKVTESGVFAILNEAMTMELTPPNRLRLINEKGTLDLLRNGS